MSECGCSVRWPVCAAGRQLWIDVQCGAALVESPSLAHQAVSERDGVWKTYNQAVLRYLRHCGYLPVSETSGGCRRAGSW